MRKSLARAIGIAALCTQLSASAGCSHTPEKYKVADELQSVGKAAAGLAALLEEKGMRCYHIIASHYEGEEGHAKTGITSAESCVFYYENGRHYTAWLEQQDSIGKEKSLEINMIEINGTYSRRQHWSIDIPEGVYRASKTETITGRNEAQITPEDTLEKIKMLADYVRKIK